MGHPDPGLAASRLSVQGRDSPAAEHLPTLLTSVDKRGQGWVAHLPRVAVYRWEQRPLASVVFYIPKPLYV